MNSSSVHNRNDSSDVDEADVRKKKRKRSVSRDLSSEMERSVGKHALTSQPSAKKSTPQKSSVQEQGKTMLKLPLGNTMGALSRGGLALSQPSPAKRPRTSKSKTKTANPPPGIIHVTGAAPASVVSSVPQGIPVHPGTLPGFPLHGATVARQVPLQGASAAALASAGRGQTFISLTPKSSDPGARVTQTLITIPRGSSPSVLSSNTAGGQTVQYIIKPQSQRHAPVSLSAVSASLSAQGAVVPSGAQIPVRTIVSAPVRQTPLSQSASSSFTSVMSLKGTAVTTQAPSFASSIVPASAAAASLTTSSSFGKFPASSAVLTSGRQTFTRVAGEATQPSTISVLTKDGNKLMVSQALSSAGLKGSYKLVSGSALQTAVPAGTNTAMTGGQSAQVVLSHPVRPSSSGSQVQVTHKGSSVPGSIVTSLPVSLAALAGKLPGNTTVSQSGGRVTLVQSTRAATIPSQMVTSVQRPTANRVTNLASGSLASLQTAVTVARTGTNQSGKIISSPVLVASSQHGTTTVAAKAVGNPVAYAQGARKTAQPTYVLSTTTVSATKVVPSPLGSTVGGAIRATSGSVNTSVPTSSAVRSATQLVSVAEAGTVKQAPVTAQSQEKKETVLKTDHSSDSVKAVSSS